MKINKFLLGVGLGTIIGLVLAPKKGSELVEDIKVGGKKAYCKAKSLTKDDVVEIYNQTILSVKKAIHDFDADEFKTSTKEKLDHLLTQLEDLKGRVIKSEEFNYLTDTYKNFSELVGDKVSIVLNKIKKVDFEDNVDEFEDELEETTSEIGELIQEMDEDLV
jgi:hypothetical protein